MISLTLSTFEVVRSTMTNRHDILCINTATAVIFCDHCLAYQNNYPLSRNISIKHFASHIPMPLPVVNFQLQPLFFSFQSMNMSAPYFLCNIIRISLPGRTTSSDPGLHPGSLPLQFTVPGKHCAIVQIGHAFAPQATSTNWIDFLTNFLLTAIRLNCLT